MPVCERCSKKYGFGPLVITGSRRLCGECYQKHQEFFKAYDEQLQKADAQAESAAWLALCNLLCAERVNITVRFSGENQKTASTWQANKEKALEFVKKALDHVIDPRLEAFLTEIRTRCEAMTSSKVPEVEIQSDGRVSPDLVGVFACQVLVDDVTTAAKAMPGGDVMHVFDMRSEKPQKGPSKGQQLSAVIALIVAPAAFLCSWLIFHFFPRPDSAPILHPGSLFLGVGLLALGWLIMAAVAIAEHKQSLAVPGTTHPLNELVTGLFAVPALLLAMGGLACLIGAIVGFFRHPGQASQPTTELAGESVAQHLAEPTERTRFSNWGLSFEYPSHWRQQTAERLALMREQLNRELRPYNRQLQEFTMIEEPNARAAIMVTKYFTASAMKPSEFVDDRNRVYEEARRTGDVTKVNTVKETIVAGLPGVEEDVERSNGGRGRTYKVIDGRTVFEVAFVVHDKEQWSILSTALDQVLSSLSVGDKSDRPGKTGGGSVPKSP